MPFAFAGLVAVSFRKERPLPNAAQDGSGPNITLVIFSDNRQRKATVQVRKVVMREAEWQRLLSPEEFAVTRRKGTERAFTGRYWNNHEAGLYRCVCCGNALFRSQEKFESGTGWPSFWAPMPRTTSAPHQTPASSWNALKSCAANATATLGMSLMTAPRQPTSAIA